MSDYKPLIMRFCIPLEPIPKKNNMEFIINRRTNKPMLLPSKRYRQYEKDCGNFIKAREKPIDFPVNVRCIFYRSTARRVDKVNLEESIYDILVHYGILQDDNFKIIAGSDGSRVYVDRDFPRTEVYIERMEE